MVARLWKSFGVARRLESGDSQSGYFKIARQPLIIGGDGQTSHLRVAVDTATCPQKQTARSFRGTRTLGPEYHGARYDYDSH